MNQNKRRKVLSLILIISCLIGSVISLNQVKAADKKEYVLYISSYSFAWESVPLQIAGVQQALSKECVINYEFMDTKNVSYDDDYKQFYDILKYKLSQRPVYDGVIAADDAALNFVQKYKAELFPHTPIAFTGIDNIEHAKEAAKDPLMCGVAEQVDYQKNIEIAKKLRPEATKIVFINDRKENGVGIQKQLKKQMSQMKDFETSYLVSTDYKKEELETLFQEFGEDTIVFLVSLGQGKNNVNYTEDERLDIIANNISVPVFRVSSTNFPDIFLGGYVIDHQQCSYLAGRMIQDGLDKKEMTAQKLVENTPGVYCFNQEMMEQYHISMSLLPKGTQIINPVPSFLESHYRVIISLFLIVFVTMLLLIIFSISRNLILSRNANEVINEQKKVLENALQTKEEFLSRMSHEMRTPLNSILGCAHLAKLNYSEQKDITEDLFMIDRAGGFLLNLINDILDVSRIEAKRIQLNREWCSPKEVIQSIEFMMIPIMQEKNIRFEYPEYKNSGVEKVEWLVDSRRVQQIVVNLLNNSAKFTPEGGTVKLEIKNISYDKKIAVDRVIVSDTGCGMTKEFISHIGEAFTQEHNEYSDKVTGSGLGLFIVKKIVELMDGELTVESELGKGSTFTFNIKYEYRIKENSANEEMHRTKEIDLKGMKILYAEDNEMNQFIGRKLLEKKGIEVVIVSNGKEAVNRIRHSQPGEYQGILMDMRMPVMGGIEATQAIRKLDHPDGKTMPIIALSADAIINEIEEAKNKGLDDYLTKPIVPNELYETLEKYWKRS